VTTTSTMTNSISMPHNGNLPTGLRVRTALRAGFSFVARLDKSSPS
jgi:hypothetical protein